MTKATKKLAKIVGNKVVPDPATEPTMEIFDISPAMATTLLAGTEEDFNLRDVDKRRVTLYAKAMLDGRWELNGTSIILDKTGRVTDGQHRLWAVIESGCTVPMVLLSGFPSSIYMNAGKGKTLSQVLRKRGVRYSSIVAAAAKNVYIWEKFGTLEYLRSNSHTPDVGEVQIVAEEYAEELGEAAYAVRHAYKVMPQSPLATIYFIMHRSCPEMMEEFMRGVVTGEGLFAGDPRLNLRKRADRIRQTKSTNDVKHNMAVLIKCWNYWAMGRKTSALIVRDNEEFPEIYQPEADETPNVWRP